MGATDTTTLVVHEQAAKTITACDEHARLVFHVWHARRPEKARKTLESWSRNASQLLVASFGGENKIFRDGELSLYVTTSSALVFGVIFHPLDYQVDPMQEGDVTLGATTARMGRYCLENVMGPLTDTPCFEPMRKGACAEHGEHDNVIALPVPGEWSFHS